MPPPIFSCSNCDAQSPKWTGQCLECGAWGTVTASSSVSASPSAKRARSAVASKGLLDLSSIAKGKEHRATTGISELDRAFGGGIVDGSVTLLGGEPGIGKSTLALMIAGRATGTRKGTVLYVSGEESGAQIKMRADRLGIATDGIRFLSETDADTVIATMMKEKPALAIIDSVQTLHSPDIPSAMGSPNQVRYAASVLVAAAKKDDIPVIIIGHVTKDGTVAGPKTLEHLVDTVLSFEGERTHALRLLRVLKNRFGSTDETGIFEMTGKGLEEVKNPSAFLIDERPAGVSGSVLSCIMEGTRPILLEVQALVQRTSFGYPVRRASGFDQARLEMLVAVIGRRGGIDLSQHDVHVNVVGGIRVREPAADLSVIMALASAAKDRPLDGKTVIWGEVGLGGEVRSAVAADRRIQEAAKLGMNAVITAKPRGRKTPEPPNLRIADVRTVRDAIAAITVREKTS